MLLRIEIDLDNEQSKDADTEKFGRAIHDFGLSFARTIFKGGKAPAVESAELVAAGREDELFLEEWCGLDSEVLLRAQIVNEEFNTKASTSEHMKQITQPTHAPIKSTLQ